MSGMVSLTAKEDPSGPEIVSCLCARIAGALQGDNCCLHGGRVQNLPAKATIALQIKSINYNTFTEAMVANHKSFSGLP